MLRRRTLLRTAAVAALAAAVAALGYPLYVAPRTDPISPTDPADAVVALGGLLETATYAQRLVAQGHAKTLVLSNPYAEPTVVDELCASATADHPVFCFFPEPTTTRGEAREIRRLSALHGWRHVIVVAPGFHLTRARLIVGRCYPDRLSMVEVPVAMTPGVWAYQYAYQSAAFVKAAILRGC